MPLGGAKQAVVADLDEPIGEHVLQEAANKLVGVQGHRLFSVAIFSISVAQGDFSVFDSRYFRTIPR